MSINSVIKHTNSFAYCNTSEAADGIGKFTSRSLVSIPYTFTSIISQCASVVFLSPNIIKRKNILMNLLDTIFLLICVCLAEKCLIHVVMPIYAFVDHLCSAVRDLIAQCLVWVP